MHNLEVRRYNAPCGMLLLAAADGRICLCDWATAGRGAVIQRVMREIHVEPCPADSEILDVAEQCLDEYFAGRRTSFGMPLLRVGTDFQKRVWDELLNIPYGKTMSYSELAARLGMPQAVRAVAGACRANAMSVLIPCHRVVAKNGALTGYAGGVDAKKFLLIHEKSVVAVTKHCPSASNK